MRIDIKKKHISLAFIIWTGVMAYLLLSPDPDVGDTKYFEGQDKVAHLVLFLVWSFLIYLIRSTSVQLDKKAVLVVVGLAVALAILTEWIQGMMPARSSDIVDIWFDLTGAVLGILFGYIAKKELIRAEKKFDK